MQDTSKQASHDTTIEIVKDGNGFAYVEPVGGRFRVIHNGRPGNPFYVIGDLAVSNDGKRVAYVAHVSDNLRRVVDGGKEGPIYNEIGTPLFTPDGKHLVYTITQDKKDYLVIDHKVHYEYQIAQDLLVSPDSRYLAFIAIGKENGRKQFIISDIALQDKKIFDCAESFIASEDRSRIAITCSEGGDRSIKIVDFQARSIISTLRVPATGNLYHLRFGPDNRSFAGGIITDDPRRFIFYNGRVVRTPAGDELLSDPLVFTEPERVGAIIGTATKARFYTDNTGHTEEQAYGYISEFTASKDGRHHAYVAIKAGGEERMRVVVDGNEGPLFDKVVSPVFSPDGRYLVYRAKQAGKRFLVVSDLKGSVVRQHKDYDMVFQPAFTGEGGSVAYCVLDGNELWMKVEKL